MTTQISTLLENLILLLPDLSFEDTYGEYLEFPEFDLMPHDYLSFAEKYIGSEDDEDKINCVSSLKRALECEIDTFIYVLGLSDLVRKNNLGFDKKLEFVAEIDLYKLTSLKKLNSVRNKIEHKYIVPEIPEIELYFELVYAFISVLESAMFMYSKNAKIEFLRNFDESPRLSVEYRRKAKAVYFKFFKSNEDDEYSFDISDIKSFTIALNIYFLLMKSTCLYSNEFVIGKFEQLGKNL